MSAKKHADAMLTLARGTGPGSAMTVLDGANPDNVPPPYVLVYFADTDPEDADSRSMEDAPDGRFVLRGYFHLVGETAEATRALAEKLRARLHGATPTIAGRSCFPIRREDNTPPRRDESTGRLVMDRVDVYRLSSEPA